MEDDIGIGKNRLSPLACHKRRPPPFPSQLIPAKAGISWHRAETMPKIRPQISRSQVAHSCEGRNLKGQRPSLPHVAAQHCEIPAYAGMV